MTKSIITITSNKDNVLDVHLEFEPAARTTGPLTLDQSAAMAGLKAIKAWAAGKGAHSEVSEVEEAE